MEKSTGLASGKYTEQFRSNCASTFTELLDESTRK